ncbi:hypothetical protein A3A84_01585 [Candidatus Collierbacteria bacterium RIFCSPLOWO2_01_FULL_50_23]|uniref:IMP dehydrogenase/GMP reductase domain-containing protein n=1 Tax=Candidatus Collierbacteria bacterium RIFCSPHIGHO2_01_FULL_50_25 TaxID=1817722 RepID=A0A1F5EX86_9BACT|nr:MAG: hypothetical protein A2703_00545 [Candidatus Collierbacteria bacterium RIFCSPHIGHO2_01_FULL_50_25]OGD74906.1 MAG: hypothetical protein A3A84_01585 [Candidatus Collierbacteria bacterium RIFCSPLOWO2_01_FULL_50_23]
MIQKGRKSLPGLKEDFDRLRSAKEGEKLIRSKTGYLEKESFTSLENWYRLSRTSEDVYPTQGLLLTPYDYLDVKSLQLLPQDFLVKTLRLRSFFLELFNHPYRISFLDKVNKGKFTPPPKVSSPALENAINDGIALSVGDLGSSVGGAQRERISRTERYAAGPFIKLGRQARSIYVGSSSPDVWNSAAAIATMAASHCLAGVPRNGLTADPNRQADLAREALTFLESIAAEVLSKRKDKRKVFNYWRKNIYGTLEANQEKAIARAKLLHRAGVRTFRVYSPEPGTGTVDTVKKLRKVFGKEIEIFAGQVISVDQAKEAVRAGADGIFVGIGGGGRCITGVRSGSVIDWPELVWKLRGEITVPIIVEGGASDHVAVTLLLGASGISVSRVVAGGTIESPGGALYCVNEKGRLFKPYGGEASARTKYLDGKLLPFDIPSFVEGETTMAEMSYVKFVYPTLTYNLHLRLEDAILALVFRGVENPEELHTIDPSPLRRITSSGEFQRNTH